MSRYRKVLTRIWEDDKFPHFSLDGRLLFLYHLTSPRSTPFLLYIEGPGAIADALRLPSPRLRQAMNELSVHKIVWYAEDHSNYVFLPRALTINENAPESPNAIKMWLSILKDLPRTPFFENCLRHWLSLREGIHHPFTLDFLKAMPRPLPMGNLISELGTGTVVRNSSSEQEPPYSPPKGTSNGFNRFWETYPKKIGKDKAAESWRKRKCETMVEEILAGLERQQGYLTREGGQFIPNPATWLNQGRWKDEPPPASHLSLKTQGNIAAVQAFIDKGKPT